jgi:expansin
VSCNVDNTVFNGHITFYDLGSAIVACHYPTSTLPQFYGAMNTADYNAAAVCGACAEVTNSQNGQKLTVLIADECPAATNQQWCFAGSHHIDMIHAAYNAIGANNNPAVTWRYVPCTVTGNIKYYIDPGSNANYLAVTIMNHRYRIAKVEVMKGGAFQSMARATYNAFILSSGAGAGPFTFRVTDIYNHVLQDSNIPLQLGGIINGSGQEALCN